MERKMECPICKKEALFVGVHDDEGNYHGLVGCEYENDPWSGLSYALHHEGWGDCPLCTDGAESTMGGMLFDTAEEAISALSPPNEPLSLEELREMDGEPVWVIYDQDAAKTTPGFDPLTLWALVEVTKNSIFLTNNLGGRTAYADDQDLEWAGITAYRRPPEGEGDTCLQ